MTMELIRSLFRMMTQLDEIAPYDILTESAAAEVQSLLRTPEDATAIRVHFLAAAMANLYYWEIMAARQEVTVTYAGTVAQQKTAVDALQAAQRLVEYYRAACQPWLRDTAFCFLQTGCPPLLPEEADAL